jgi:hypothetical protein
MDTPIEREPCGTDDYEEKFARLSRADQRAVSVAEEFVLADTARTHARRTLTDGTVFDLAAYHEFDNGLTLDGSPTGARSSWTWCFTSRRSPIPI